MIPEMFTVYLLTILMSATSYAIIPQTIRIGGLFPMTGHPAGAERAGVFRLAIEQINQRTDLLPNTTLECLLYNTGATEQGALVGSLEIANMGNATGIIGSSASSESKVAAIVSNVYKLPQISYASTDATLSNKNQYPFFLRTVPPDSLQGLAIVSIIQGIGWKQFALIYSTNDYGSSIAQIILNAASKSAINVLAVATFFQGSTDLSTQMDAIKRSDARVIVLCCSNADVPAVMRSAVNAGLIGDKYAWIGSDAVVQNTNFRFSNGTVLSDVESAMRGMIGTIPSGGRGELYEEFLDVWNTLNTTEYPGAGSTPNFADPYVYDSLLAFCYAYQNLIDRGLWPAIVNPEFTTKIHATILNTTFVGLTGPVSFDQNGDRLGSYSIVNMKFNVSSGSFFPVGTWDTTNGSALWPGTVVWRDGSGNPPSDGLVPSSISSGSNYRDLTIAVSVVGSLVIIAVAVTNIVFFWKRKAKTLRQPDFKVIEFGDLLKGPTITKKQMLSLVSFEDLILQTKFVSILISIPLDQKEKEMILRTVFYIYRANEKAIELVTYFAEKELPNAKPDTLFREDSITTKLFRRYTRVVGLKYLWKTLAPILDQLNDEIQRQQKFKTRKHTSEIQMISFSDDIDPSEISPHFEVDPSRLTESDDEKLNKLNLLLLCQKTFSSVIRSESTFPTELRKMLAILHQALRKQFPDLPLHSYIGGFVFLRFICSAIIAPHLYGLFERAPTNECQRVLVLLSKVLQNLSNGVSFGGKEDFMMQLNDFVSTNLNEVRSFLDNLSKDTVVDITFDIDEEGVGVPDAAHWESLRLLKEMIGSHKTALFEKLTAQLEKEPDHSMKDIQQHLNLILSIE